MEALTEQAILDRTHYGLKVMAHVLRAHYPNETVLQYSGRKCLPAKNPFNGHKKTLLISVPDDRMAIWEDTEEPTLSGNVFDFARLHFQCGGEALLRTLNNALHLRIGENVRNWGNEIAKPEPENEEVFQLPHFSYFRKPIKNVQPYKEVTLAEVYKVVKGAYFIKQTNHLRKLPDKKEARKYKAFHFDYVTFSGTFSKRGDQFLKKHSGLMALDFDHVPNLPFLKARLLADEYFETQMLFTSPSGDGLKWIVSIDLETDTHQNYFNAISNYVKHTYNLEVDASGKDISRACFLPYDPDAYLHPHYHQKVAIPPSSYG